MLILCAFHTFILYIVLFLYAAFLCFLLCMFLLYITVLLPVGVIKDDRLWYRGGTARRAGVEILSASVPNIILPVQFMWSDRLAHGYLRLRFHPWRQGHAMCVCPSPVFKALPPPPPLLPIR